MMMDAMAPETILSQFYQTENVDFALVKVKLDLCIKDLEKVKLMKSGYCKQLIEHLSSDKFREHHEITRISFDVQVLAKKIVDSLINNILKRFPNTDLLTAFGVLGMRPISMLSAEEFEIYGAAEISTLCEFFGQSQTVNWTDETGDHEATSQPVIDKAATIDEWKLAKMVVKAELYPRDNIVKLWHLVNMYHAKDFPNLIALARLALTSAVHTAGCERGFSVQNQILVKHRNRLSVEKQTMLMRIKMSSSSRTDLVEKALPVFKEKRDRRIFEVK